MTKLKAVKFRIQCTQWQSSFTKKCMRWILHCFSCYNILKNKKCIIYDKKGKLRQLWHFRDSVIHHKLTTHLSLWSSVSSEFTSHILRLQSQEAVQSLLPLDAMCHIQPWWKHNINKQSKNVRPFWWYRTTLPILQLYLDASYLNNIHSNYHPSTAYIIFKVGYCLTLWAMTDETLEAFTESSGLSMSSFDRSHIWRDRSLEPV